MFIETEQQEKFIIKMTSLILKNIYFKSLLYYLLYISNSSNEQIVNSVQKIENRIEYIFP